jgi:predicted neutral ceramidase superfamily lipid hydrolase
MSVGQYGNELLSMVSAICGIVAITMFCQLYSTRLFRYLGQNTMVFFAWHSRIVLVACGMIFSALNVFQDRDSNLIMAFGYTIVVLIAIFALLYPATEIIKRTKYHAFFGV